MIKILRRIVIEDSRAFRRISSTHASAISVGLALLAETSYFSRCEETLEYRKLGRRTQRYTLSAFPERLSHICDSHFRAFLLITQASIGVKIISDDHGTGSKLA